MIYSNEYILVADDALLESGFFEEIDKWKAANQDSSIKKYRNNMLTEEEYDKMKTCIDIMKETEDYDEYKKAFNRFCYFCHIVPRGVILVKYDLKKGKENHNSLHVDYSYNTKRMQLPEGVTLYHMSKVDRIKELIPFFRGKSVKGYMYDKPRIYFTIKKNMPKIMADYKAKEKMHMYICKEKIKYAFVDPLLWGYASGAVYIETDKPIKVDEVNDNKEIKEKNDKALKEQEFDLDNFLDFVTENGLILDE